MDLIVVISGQRILIDQKNLPIIEKHRWFVNNKGYLQSAHKGKTIYFHRLIMKAKKGQMIDHINRKTTDNREKNLRYVTHRQNVYNSGPRQANAYKGVHFHPRVKKWASEIRCNGQYYFLGYFQNIRDAAVAYNTMAKFLYGEYAYLNHI